MWTAMDFNDQPDWTEEELSAAIQSLRENHQIELKEAAGSLPKSFWETCSSFANTEGGNIILGVKETVNGNLIVGVSNPEKIIQDLWNSMNSREKISQRVIGNHDIVQKILDGKIVILVTVNELPRHQKPVYLLGKLENTYIRTGDGDRRATNDEIAALLRNTSLNADSQIASGFGVEDLDLLSLQKFRELIISRYPKRNFSQLSDEDFLIQIGGALRNRKTGEFNLYTGTILFLGKTNAIRELFEHFHADYFEYDDGSENRYEFRISDNDFLNQEINLLSFYLAVFNRLLATVREPFSLNENLIRNAEGEMTEISLREALVNALVHADYQMSNASVRIDHYKNRLVFSNPGQMLVSRDEFFTGGKSEPRNELLMKFFSLAGFAERQGFGGSSIFQVSKKRAYRLPELVTSLERTTLTIWTEKLSRILTDLTPEEKIVLGLLEKRTEDEKLSFSQLHHQSGISEYYLRKTLNTLLEKKYIRKSGKGRAVHYFLSEEL